MHGNNTNDKLVITSDVSKKPSSKQCEQKVVRRRKKAGGNRTNKKESFGMDFSFM